MLRPFVKQDAILGHVASRGDRNPRSFNKAPAAFIVNHQVALIWIKRVPPPIPQALSATTVTIAKEVNMADTTKLSVEKALNKIRETDARTAKTDKVDEEIDALNEETKRLREQRVRLERLQRRSTKRD
jgi:hypothetical protein